MKRTKVKELICITSYHTQESRKRELGAPIICKRNNAWLGKGYYFWVDEEFAHYWGEDMKSHRNGLYDIYKADIVEENLLNATFDESNYYFFKESVEKARIFLHKKGMNPTLKKVHRFVADNIWPKYRYLWNYF